MRCSSPENRHVGGDAFDIPVDDGVRSAARVDEVTIPACSLSAPREHRCDGPTHGVVHGSNSSTEQLLPKVAAMTNTVKIAP
ncbi:hypothetical protein RHCRD62_30487 [Rhodococcus sp. RD6.2]|nr:hypothetical protein RHCRD62_30487 [Rhodococcus sp. RD6.2]